MVHFGVAGKRRQQCCSPGACSKKCNKYDVTSAAQPFLLPPIIIMIGPSGLLFAVTAGDALTQSNKTSIWLLQLAGWFYFAS